MRKNNDLQSPQAFLNLYLSVGNLPEAMMQLNRLDGQTGVARKRAKLSLPAPVVSEAEINAIM